MRYCGLLTVIVMSFVFANAVNADDASAKSKSAKTIEERLEALEQRQMLLEQQLKIEREKTELLEDSLAKSQAELAKLKSSQSVQVANNNANAGCVADSCQIKQSQIEQIIDERLEAKKDEFASPEWVQRMKIKGDFRYRFENINDESESSERNRSRIRARIGLYGEVNDELDYGFRLASGNDDRPTSTNQDLGDLLNDLRTLDKRL